MKEFKKRRQLKRKLYSKFVIILLIFVIIILAKGTWGVFQKAHQSKNKLEISQDRVIELNKRQEAIISKIEILKSDTGVEEEIRTKYDVAREGEHVIVIVQDNNDDEPKEEEVRGIKGLFKKVTSIFD